jgi:hypothetical protein
VRLDEFRVDLDGILKLDFGTLELAFVEVLLPLVKYGCFLCSSDEQPYSISAAEE